MQIRKVTASYGRTINLGDFNSLRLDATFEADVEPGEDPLDAINHLFAEARAEVKRQALSIVQQNRLRLEEVIRHLPDDVQQQIYAIAKEATQ